MNTAIVSALAALGGSSVGALTPVLSNYVLQRSVTQRHLANREIEQRETLYADFIKEGSRLYANSITHGLDDIDELVALYSLVNRIRLFASEPVVHAAESFVKQIVQHHGEPDVDVRPGSKRRSFVESRSPRYVQSCVAGASRYPPPWYRLRYFQWMSRNQLVFGRRRCLSRQVGPSMQPCLSN